MTEWYCNTCGELKDSGKYCDECGELPQHLNIDVTRNDKLRELLKAWRGEYGPDDYIGHEGLYCAQELERVIKEDNE